MKKTNVIKFILMLILCGIAGGVVSVAIGANHVTLNSLCSTVYRWLCAHILVVQIVCTVGILGGSVALYACARRRHRLLETDPDQIDEKVAPLLDAGLVVNSCLYVVMFVLYSVVVQADISIAAVPVFVLSCFGAFAMEIVYIRLIKRIYPRRKGDPLSMKFADEWLASCDELERRVTYLAAYKTMTTLRYVILGLFALYMLVGISIPIGVLPQLTLAVLWIYCNVYNLHITRKLTRLGKFE